uniref:Uncharacterized protein n=1 Tax=viral metagenome TaxID=1070528 RepID=A0A6C0KJS5_9ZZZZ
MCSVQPKQANLTSSKWDDVHQADDQRISTYAGRYAFVPFRNCFESFPVNATTRLQESGNGWVAGKWRTEVESDLKGIGRPPSKWREDDLLYDPRTNEMNLAGYANGQDENFPQNFNRLTNPPCTLRTTGWNRWQPLLHNPQAAFETPFDHFIPSRDIDKYKFRTHLVPATNFTKETIESEKKAKQTLLQ